MAKKLRAVRCRAGQPPEIAVFEDANWADVFKAEFGAKYKEEWFQPDNSYFTVYRDGPGQVGNRIGIATEFLIVPEDESPLTSFAAGEIIRTLYKLRDPKAHLDRTYDRFLDRTTVCVEFDGFTLGYEEPTPADPQAVEVRLRLDDQTACDYQVVVFLLDGSTRIHLKLSGGKMAVLPAVGVAAIRDASVVEIALIGNVDRREMCWDYRDHERFMCLLAEAGVVQPPNAPPDSAASLCQKCHGAPRDSGERYCDRCAEEVLEEMKAAGFFKRRSCGLRQREGESTDPLPKREE